MPKLASACAAWQLPTRGKGIGQASVKDEERTHTHPNKRKINACLYSSPAEQIAPETLTVLHIYCQHLPLAKTGDSWQSSGPETTSKHSLKMGHVTVCSMTHRCGLKACQLKSISQGGGWCSICVRLYQVFPDDVETHALHAIAYQPQVNHARWAVLSLRCRLPPVCAALQQRIVHRCHPQSLERSHPGGKAWTRKAGAACVQAGIAGIAAAFRRAMHALIICPS